MASLKGCFAGINRKKVLQLDQGQANTQQRNVVSYEAMSRIERNAQKPRLVFRKKPFVLCLKP